MTTLQFRLPGRVQPLGAWLALLLPALDRRARRRLVEDGCVHLDGRVVDRSTLDCPPGARVRVEEAPAEAIESVGQGSHRRWQAIVDDPPWPAGAIAATGGSDREFERVEVRGDLARLIVEGEACDASEVCRALSRAAMPVVGDLEGGGLGVAGGPRLAPLDDEAPGICLDWPHERVWRADVEDEAVDDGEAAGSGAAELFVSRETGRALEADHPWILPDEASDPADRFRPGSLVRVIERGKGPIGWARVEASPRLAARLWAAGPLDRREIPSVESRVARAIARRRALLVPVTASGTNAFRLIHGEGDGLPGLFVDRLGPLLRVLVSGWASQGFRERAIDALRMQLPMTPEGESWSVLELLHMRGPSSARFDRVRWLAGGIEEIRATGCEMQADTFFVEERGLRFAVDPGWGLPRKPRPGFGLFVDQRDNRERLATHARAGGRWLNLFAHTGAFSVALLAAGAERVVSVDLSGAYLDRLESNLVANRERGVDPARHETIRGDVRRYLEDLDPSETFRGIVIDPPTAAAAGRRFWSVKQDLEPLLRLAIERLEGGGLLLVTQNRAGPPLGLDRVLSGIASDCGRSLLGLERAPAGLDHPSLAGFPEGDPFEGWLLTLG